MDFSKDNSQSTRKTDEQEEEEQQQRKDDNKEVLNDAASTTDTESPKTTDSDKTFVITLQGTHLGATDTEGILESETDPIVESKESKHVSFKESDSSSTTPILRTKGIIKVRASASAPAIVIQHEHSGTAEHLEPALPQSEPDYMSHYDEGTESSDTRIQHILSLFDHLSKNLETIENHLTNENLNQRTDEPIKKSSSSSSKDDLVQIHKSHVEIHHEKGHHERRSSLSSRSSRHQSSCSSELRITQLFQLPQRPRKQQWILPHPTITTRSSYHTILEQGEATPDYTYMQAPSYIVDMTTTVGPTETSGSAVTAPNVVIKQTDLLKKAASKKQINRPPCERTFHTITISTNTPAQRPRANRNRNWMTRCGNVFSDFITALCLCLQVNKDCVFCLGFFVAFVVSASFLTAFFYRTLNMTPQTIHIQQEGVYNEHHNPTTVRLTGFYYIYNRHHPIQN